MARRLDIAQASLVGIIGFLTGYFVFVSAAMGPLTLAAVFWLLAAIGLLVHFGAKLWQFLYIHAPLLIGIAMGYWVALGMPGLR